MHQSATVLLNRLLARGKFRHVQVLLKLAELGSVQRTAESIGLTQSSVTQTLAYLERLLETQLFQRHARGVRPTPACADLLPVARQLMLAMAEGAEAIVARRHRGQVTVRLAASASATNAMLLPVLPRFAELEPSVQVHLREAEGDDLLLGIARAEIDLVACRRPAVLPEGWVFHPLLDDRLAVVCAVGHPLALRRQVQWCELASQTWLLSPAGSVARQRFDELATVFPAGPRVYPVVTRALTTIWRLVHGQALLGLVPVSAIRPLLDAGELAEVRVSGKLELEPLGLLAPAAGLPEAPAKLLAFVRASQAAT